MLLFALAACGPMIVAWPPPASLPGGISEIDRGQGELGGGLSGMLMPTEEQVSILPNWFGGTVVGQGRLGLGNGWDVGLDVSKHLLGPTAGLSGGKWFVVSPTLSVGPVFGVAGSSSTGSVGEQDRPREEDGSASLFATLPYDYAYLTVAPSIGGRLSWKPMDHFQVPVLLRVSGAAVIPTENVSWARKAMYVDLVSGVRLDYDRFAFGIGPGFHASMEPNLFWWYADLQLSAHVRLGHR